MLGRNDQAFILPPNSALAGNCQGRLFSLKRQSLKTLTAGDNQLTTFLEAALLNPFLEKGLLQLCLPELSLKIISRGWPTICQES